MFNFLYYLYSEDAQKEIKIDRVAKPTIRLVFMKHLNGKMPYEAKDEFTETATPL